MSFVEYFVFDISLISIDILLNGSKISNSLYFQLVHKLQQYYIHSSISFLQTNLISNSLISRLI